MDAPFGKKQHKPKFDLNNNEKSTKDYYDYVSRTTDDNLNESPEPDLTSNSSTTSKVASSSTPIKIVDTKSLPIQISSSYQNSSKFKLHQANSPIKLVDLSAANFQPQQHHHARPLIKIKSSTTTCVNDSVRVRPEYKLNSARVDAAISPPQSHEFDRTIESAHHLQHQNSSAGVVLLNNTSNTAASANSSMNASSLDNQHMMWVRLIQATMDST